MFVVIFLVVRFLEMHAKRMMFCRSVHPLLVPCEFSCFTLELKACVFVFLSQNHRSVVAFSIRPLEDMNEITSHMLEVVQAHMVLSKPQTMVRTFT